MPQEYISGESLYNIDRKILLTLLESGVDTKSILAVLNASNQGIADLESNGFKLADTEQLDAFGRQRVSNPTYVFDAQLTYGLQELLLESIVSGAGASLTHDATNRCALMTMSNSPAGAQTILQSFEHFRYQPGRGQTAVLTFVFGAAVPGVRRFVGYSDGINGIELQQNESGGLQIVRYSATGVGDLIIPQAQWNIDRMDGIGPSGRILDVTKSQILDIDFQALYVGRVRVGLVIDGVSIPLHYALHANIEELPYIQSANLPARFGMEVMSGSASATMRAICMSVISEGGQIEELGEPVSANAGGIAGNNTAVHLVSFRPKATFNGIVNRSKIILTALETLVTGNTSVRFDIVIGQAITGASWSDVNTAFSSMERSGGTASGAPALVLASIFVGASNQSKSSASRSLESKLPICLDAAGVARLNGTISILATGLGGTSQSYAALLWKELR